MIKILFTGGGSAGHISPIVAVARSIKKKYKGQGLQLFYLGPKDGFSEKLLLQEGVEIKTILAGKIRRYFGLKILLQNIFDIFLKMPIGFVQALFYVFVISPDVIFSKGGYGSLPVVTAGWLLLTPIFLHESDATPGLANRLVSRFSLEIFVSFPAEKTGYFPPQKMISVGNPVREEILAGGKEEKAKDLFKLSGEKPLLLVLGGSQGSQRINDVLLAIAPEILTQFELIHQTGENNFRQVVAESKVVIAENLQKYYHPFSFLEEEELKHALKAAQLVVSRAGSSTIFEIAAAGKAALLIPLPEAAQDHQLKNAYAYAQSGACQVIEQINLTPHFFLERIKYLFSRPDKLAEMQNSAKDFSRPQAADIIAEYIVEYLTQ
jgi:UDP-N-acetylglucosamine--N-acetylmuramyl-(pentapeptide) pyrophosphoryl-undecaprenol N-acetylglucosamine transferase